MTIHIASDDEFSGCIWEIHATSDDGFEREEDPPTDASLQIIVDDGASEYALPWPYRLRDGDFYSEKSGLALHDSIAVVGWKIWGQ